MPPSKAQLKAKDQIEEIVHSLAHATNGRQLDRSTNSLFDEVLSNDFSVAGGPPTVLNQLGLDAFLAAQQAVYLEYPEAHVEYTSLDTKVDVRAGTAQVFANYEVTGQPPGVVRKYTAIFWFRREGKSTEGTDVWRCTRFMGMEGMDAPIPF